MFGYFFSASDNVLDRKMTCRSKLFSLIYKTAPSPYYDASHSKTTFYLNNNELILFHCKLIVLIHQKPFDILFSIQNPFPSSTIHIILSFLLINGDCQSFYIICV